MKLQKVDLHQVLNTVLEYTKAKRLILCIDEIAKLDEESIDMVVYTVTNLYNSFPSKIKLDLRSCVRVFVTSLDGMIGLREFTKISPKLIQWVLLPLLQISEVKKLLMTDDYWKNNFVGRLLIKHSSGHPRTLGALQLGYNKISKALTYTEAFYILEGYLRDFRLIYGLFTIDQLSNVLLGNFVKEGDKIRDLTYEQAISSGLMLKDTKSQTNIEMTTTISRFINNFAILPMA